MKSNKKSVLKETLEYIVNVTNSGLYIEEKGLSISLNLPFCGYWSEAYKFYEDEAKLVFFLQNNEGIVVRYVQPWYNPGKRKEDIIIRELIPELPFKKMIYENVIRFLEDVHEEYRKSTILE